MFAQALNEIVRRLEEAKARHLVDRYALIGGFALAAWGIPRATHDVDFALAMGASDPTGLSRLLQAEFQSGDPDDPLRGVFRTSVIAEGHSIPIQLVLLPPRWNAIVFQDVESIQVFHCTVPVVSWQALLLLKLYAGGPQDLLDAQQILAVREPNPGERHAVATLAKEMGLATMWRRVLNR